MSLPKIQGERTKRFAVSIHTVFLICMENAAHQTRNEERQQKLNRTNGKINESLFDCLLFAVSVLYYTLRTSGFAFL